MIGKYALTSWFEPATMHRPNVSHETDLSAGAGGHSGGKSSGAESEVDPSSAPGTGGVMDRDAIKMRTLKLTHKRVERAKH